MEKNDVTLPSVSKCDGSGINMTGKNLENPGNAITVKGTVSDVQAKPVAGASIKSVYSGKTATSDKNGRYSIASVENDVLTISAKGLETLNIDVNKTKNIDVKLDYSHE